MFAFHGSWLQRPEIRASTPTALTATATSPLAVDVSAMRDGRGLDATTELEVGVVVYAFKECANVSHNIHTCRFLCVCVHTYYCVTEYSSYTHSTYILTYLAVLAVVVVVYNVPLSHLHANHVCIVQTLIV